MSVHRKRIGHRDGVSVTCKSDQMTKTQYYTATSIDGFIADENNSLDWLFAASSTEKKEDRFGTFFAGVGAMVMGATTYEWVLEHDQLLEHPTKWQGYDGDTPCWCSRTATYHPFQEPPCGSFVGTSHPCTRRWSRRPAARTSGSSVEVTWLGSSSIMDCWTKFISGWLP